MIRPKLILLPLLLVVGTIWTSSAFAQARSNSIRGPISPWMDIFQRKPGPLDNYHSYVRPEIQLQRQVDQQNSALTQNALGLQSLGQQMQNGQKESQVNPTGTGSVFMSYSHYYPMKGGGAAAHPRSMSRGAASSSGGRSTR